MKKILTILGARPQFIKAATVSRAIKNHGDNLQEIIVHTGQHYDNNMSEIFFQEMSIPQPKYSLKTGNKSHGEMTGLMIMELEKIMIKEKPDLVMIYGDTNSTLAASISAAKLLIPIAHIEAGMRSGNKQMPEEINRVLSDHISTYFFCTTDEPAQNLRNENIHHNIHVVGDVMYDATLYYQKYAKAPINLNHIPSNFYLATCHRQENTDSKTRLAQIFAALQEIALNEAEVILPIHPRTRKYLEQYDIDTKHITMIEPIGYLEMIYLIQKSKLVITDSGGLQREAYYFDRPVVIANESTEWKELVSNNVAKLAGADCINILAAVRNLMTQSNFPKNIYGNGQAAEKIVEIIYQELIGK